MEKLNFSNIESILSQIPQNYKSQKISILLPYYNEADIIVNNTKEILDKTKSWGLNTEIVISDDGSKDNGFELLTQEFAHHPSIKLVNSNRNYGKGRALLTAYEESTGELVLFLDCDLELPIEHLPYFLLQMINNQQDVVIGSKEHPQSQLHYPLIRKIFSRGYSILTKILFNLSVPDTQTGIKLFKRDVLENTLPYLLVKRFAFDIELLALITHKKYSISSHPIVLNYTRNVDVGRMSIDTILHMFKDTFATFWRLKSGFWKNTPQKKENYSILNISFDPLDENLPHTQIIKEWEDIKSITNIIEKYDLVMFKQQNEEIPSFTHHSLQRVFSNQSIDMILPYLNPLSTQKKEELFYGLLGNLFFFKGYYERYRPVIQGNLPPIKKQGISLFDFVYRTKTFLEILSKEQNPYHNNTLANLPNAVHTPFVYTHRSFPQTFKEFFELIKNISSSIGIKKQAKNIYVFTFLLFVLAIFTHTEWLVLPWIFIELIIHTWYIYSLGIRKGISYLLLFNQARIYTVFFKIFPKKNKS